MSVYHSIRSTHVQTDDTEDQDGMVVVDLNDNITAHELTLTPHSLVYHQSDDLIIHPAYERPTGQVSSQYSIH